MNIKAAVFDLDGTLYGNDAKVSHLNKEALKSIKEQGILIGIATGRNSFGIEKNNKELFDLADFIVEENGASVFDHKESIIIGEDIDIDEFYNLYDSFGNYMHAFFFSDSNNQLYTGGDAVLVENFLRFADEDARIIEVNDVYKYKIKKICIMYNYKDDKEIQSIVQIFPFSHLSHTQSVPMLFELQDINTNKSNALSKYLSTKGISMKEVIAFGDGNNDIEMIRDAGIGVAMKNAMSEVKAVANDITEYDANHDGVAAYLQNKIIKLYKQKP